MSKNLNIAINGFGRIGRAVCKIIIEKYPSYKIVAINDLTDTETLAHLLKYDSAYGIYDKNVSADEKNIIINSKKIPLFSEKDPTLLPWGKMKVDVVLECTGRFTNKESLNLHIEAGAKKVILSAPAKGESKVKTIVIGVNDDKINKDDNILSCASCTTNCLAPVTDIIRKNFGIKKALMSTIHAYTADQNLVDGPHKDLRRARSAALNIVPTTTGAASAIAQTIPSLKGFFDGLAVRVPIAVGSLCDTVFLLKKKVKEEDVVKVFIKASKEKKYKNIIEASSEPLVSSDIVKNSHSAIVDLSLTKVVDGDLLKVISWYDNEWGYSCRLADLISYLKF
ncbi:type I glyceraldehyde-3-phosphate dehydrogenase [Candidatus Falkowbacteria bacterium HGW-Falkowbacteria-1]|jgi:glyceraldehyde 3-phosphate dehydrogenase|uniref:Glyceraldehyde-3-phosphate dehydrogenase n=1 Tax=Candidatus Falkowbacteria bacterium HGW-Falkowbacteria-1 TaxID=2013768 RepID=A0A2N2E9R8_9BACT|nr:MAG: type I glyceraldehyde-3-phosphate dehydrogenase [Candidatus Falkowbacteria bacterium HGW-Falkowbacteria-1]